MSEKNILCFGYVKVKVTHLKYKKQRYETWLFHGFYKRYSLMVIVD